SVRAVGKEGRDRDDQDLCVERQGPVTRIERVACDALVVARRAAAADLPQAGNSGSASEVLIDRTRVPLQFLVSDGARADDAHLAPQDVEELRQLVEAG